MTAPQRSPSQEHWLRIFNTVVYNSFAPLYDSMDWLTFGVWWRLVRRALDYVPEGETLLEVGFGPGKLHIELARHSRLCFGLDRATGMCRFTQRRLRRNNLPIRVIQGSVDTLPYPTDSFDSIVSTFAFSGFPSGTDAMREMARVTKPTGHVVLIDIGLPEDHNRIGTFLARLWERAGDLLYNQPELMREAGLNVTVFKEFGPGRHIRAIVGQKPLPAPN